MDDTSPPKIGRVGRLVLFGVLFAVAAAGATRVNVSDDAAEAMLPTDPVTVARYQDYLDRFPSDQGALVVFERLLCSEDGWQLIKEAERAFRASPHIDRTLSLASPSARYIVETEEGLDLSRFSDVSFASGAERCDAAKRYPPFSNLLVSEDAHATALFLIAAGDIEATRMYEALNEIFEPFAQRAEAFGGKMVITAKPS